MLSLEIPIDLEIDATGTFIPPPLPDEKKAEIEAAARDGAFGQQASEYLTLLLAEIHRLRTSAGS